MGLGVAGWQPWLVKLMLSRWLGPAVAGNGDASTIEHAPATARAIRCVSRDDWALLPVVLLQECLSSMRI
jgi:hypothetical protein